MKDFVELHKSLSAVAKEQNCTESHLQRAVSRHTLPETASFANLEAIRAAADVPCFVGTSAKELSVSAHFEAHTNLPADDDDSELRLPAKKRRRSMGTEEQAERVAEARMRLLKSMPDLPHAELDIAEMALTKLVNQLRGSEGEVCVQSYALLGKKLAKEDPRPRVVIAVRLHAGVAMSVDRLKEALGSCWADGLLTTLRTLHGISEVDLPYSPEAQAALAFGNAPLLMVTSVATR
mgnify:CR=1 FL=1